MKNLYTAVDVKEFSKAFGSIGMSRAQIVVSASNDNEQELIPVKTINISLVKMINQLAELNGYLKQKLDNSQTVDKNMRMAEREAQIENVPPAPKVIQQDAEKVDGSSAGGMGLLGVGALGLLAFEPVREAIGNLVGLATDAGKFATSVLGSINSLFSSMFSGTPDATVQPSAEGGVAPSVAPAAPVGEGTTTAESPPVPQAVPEQKPGFVASTLTGALVGGAAGSIVPGVGSGVGAAVGAAVGAYKYFTTPSTPSSSTPAATGGPTTGVTPATSAPSSKTSKAAEETKPGTTPSNIIQVNHPETGSGWGITGAVDQSGRPLAFTKEGATAFAKMMQDSGGAVKPSDVASSKRSVAKNNSLRNAAKNSPHLRGVAMDIHGTSAAWIRQHGHKYGWKPHDYKGTHGGHFVFGGAGMVPDEGSVAGTGTGSGIVGEVASTVTAGIEETAKILGAVAGALVGKTTLKSISTPLPDMSSFIQENSIQEKAAIVQSKEPKALPKPAPPNINMSGSSATIQNPPTMLDRNRLYYYIDRFGFEEVNKPTLVKSTTA